MKRYMAIGLLATLSTGCATAQPGLLRTLIVSQLADNVSTQVAVGQGRHEVNPYLPDNPWGNGAIQLGTTVMVAYLLHKWEPSNPKLVHTLEGLGIGLGTRDTIVNLNHWSEDRK